ncbi:hypothetical protein FOK61_19665, partial [Salmonella enterica]|nr:hypothetical protein [Salmonella enterica]
QFYSPFSCPSRPALRQRLFLPLFISRYTLYGSPASTAETRTVIFCAVMQETHSTIHTCILPLPSWLIRSFCFRLLACGYNQHIIKKIRGSLWRNK